MVLFTQHSGGSGSVGRGGSAPSGPERMKVSARTTRYLAPSIVISLAAR